MNATDRLAEQLDQKEQEIDELRERLAEAERRLDAGGRWQWPEELPKEQTLPVPRLEIVWKSDPSYGWRHRVALYRLVYRHFLGHVIGLPLGKTSINGGDGSPPNLDGELALPFRDGAHIKSDALHLKLRAFVVCEDRADEIDLSEHANRFGGAS